MNAVLSGELAQSEVWPSLHPRRRPRSRQVEDRRPLGAHPVPRSLRAEPVEPGHPGDLPAAGSRLGVDQDVHLARRTRSASRSSSASARRNWRPGPIPSWSSSTPSTRKSWPPSRLASRSGASRSSRPPGTCCRRNWRRRSTRTPIRMATLQTIADEWNRLLDQDPPTAPYVEGVPHAVGRIMGQAVARLGRTGSSVIGDARRTRGSGRTRLTLPMTPITLTARSRLRPPMPPTRRRRRRRRWSESPVFVAVPAAGRHLPGLHQRLSPGAHPLAELPHLVHEQAEHQPVVGWPRRVPGDTRRSGLPHLGSQHRGVRRRDRRGRAAAGSGARAGA